MSSVSPSGHHGLAQRDGLGPLPLMDFTYNETEAHFAIVFGAFLTLIATISVIARVYSRYFVANHVGLDDFMAVGALLATISVNVLQSQYAAVYLPHANELSLDNTPSKLFYTTKILYTLGVGFYKLTFLVQFWRIFRYIYWMRILYLVAIVLITCWSVSQVLVHVMTCLPLEANWAVIDPTTIDMSTAKMVCLPMWIPTYLNAGGTVLTDIIVLILPIPALWQLKLRRSQKWAAFGVFGIGGIVPLISAGRIWALGYPPPSGFVRQSCFNIAELSAGVITAGLATVRLLISRHFPARSLGTLPSERHSNSRTRGDQYSKSLGLSRISSSLNSKGAHDTQLSSRSASDAQLYETADFGGTRTRWNEMSMGNRATVTTGRYDRPMNEGGAEFLKEFGITVEVNWEVTETVVVI